MNEDSRREGVMSKALKITGAGTMVAGAGYGIHKGINSAKMANFVDGKDNLIAKGVSKYKSTVNPMVDKTGKFVKDTVSGKRSMMKEAKNKAAEEVVKAGKIIPDIAGSMNSSVASKASSAIANTSQKATQIGPTIANAAKKVASGSGRVGPTIANAAKIVTKAL